MIETREAMDNLDAIAAVPGIDVLFVGPADLSITLSKGQVWDPHSAEVEAAIMELDAVRECAVIGIPHDHWGEQVHAVVVSDGGTDEAEIIAHAKARLGGVKAPKSVSFADSIPRTAAGKMDKKTLRKQFWGDQDRMVN